SVGFEYESCLDLILWEKRTAVLQGYELDASNMGFWTLDKHHVLDVQNEEFSAALISRTTDTFYDL
ncbi:teneurin-3 isoform X1, partial [Tachysurus ichikawai]